MFEQSILAAPRHTGRSATFAVSASLQVLVVGTLLIVPLFFIEQPTVARLSAALLAPPAPRVPESIKLVEVPKAIMRRFLDSAVIYAPRTIPPKAAVLVDDPADFGPPTLTTGTGVPGGTGQPGGTSVLDMLPRTAPPPPAEPAAKPLDERAVETPKPTAPIRVGGDVQNAKIIRRVVPTYPPLAKAARISGTVRLLGVLSRDGRIQQLQVLSGHPLLVAAAVEAVKQWLYEPTLLNGQPVEVIAPIDVTFTLSH